MPDEGASAARAPGRVTRLVSSAYAFSIPFDGWSIAGHRSPTFFLGVAMIACLALESTGPHRSSFRLPAPIYVLGLVALVGYSFASVMWSVAPDLSQQYSLSLLVSAASAMALAAILPRIPRKIVASFQLGVILMSILLLASPPDDYGRRSVAGDPNIVGATLGLAVALALTGPRGATPQSKTLRVATIAIGTLGILASASRAATLGLIASLVVFAMAAHGNALVKGARIVALSMGAYAVIAVAQAYAWLPERLTAIDEELTSGTLNNRTDIWASAMAHGDSLFGIGVGATPAITAQALGWPAVAHNVPIGVWLEWGVVGSVLVACVVLQIIRYARRSPFFPSLIVAGPGIVAATMTLTLETSRYLWFVIALATVSTFHLHHGTYARHPDSQPRRYGRV